MAVAGLLLPLLLLRWWCGLRQRRRPADLSTAVLPTWNAGAVAGDGRPPLVRRPKTASRPPTDVQAALAIVLPRSGWRVVQAIRQRHDRGYERWMPHINLLFPFVSPQRFAEGREEIEAIARSTAAFQMQFTQLDVFHTPRFSVLWAKPETDPNGVFQDLHGRVLQVFPECFRPQFPQFTPHMSIGQFPRADVMEAKARFEGDIVALPPVEVYRLQYLTRTRTTPFIVAAEFDLRI